MRKLRDTTELDYLTHVVFRMYENKRCAHPAAAACLSCGTLSSSHTAAGTKSWPVQALIIAAPT